MKAAANALLWRRFDLLIIASAIAASVLLCVLIFRVDPAIFRVDARSDVVRIGFPQGNALPWPGAWMTTRPGCANAVIRIAIGSEATISWQPDAPADILIEHPDGKPAATLFCPQDSPAPMASVVRLAVPSMLPPPKKRVPQPAAPGTFLLLPFNGTLRIGAGVIDGGVTPPMLRTARITVEMPASLTGAGRTDIEHKVETGDVIEFIAPLAPAGTAQAPLATMAGFLQFDAEPGIRVVARGRARDASVSFYGAEKAEPGVIAPTLFGRLKASAEYIIIVPVLWLLAAALRAFRRIADPAQRPPLPQPAPPPQPVIAPVIALVFGLALALNAAPLAAQASVATITSSRDSGVGIVFAHPGGCRILTARHVLGWRPGTTTRGDTTVQVRFGDGRVTRGFERWHQAEIDISILELESPPAKGCALLSPAAAARQLEAGVPGILMLPAPPGSFDHIPVQPTARPDAGRVLAAETVAGPSRLVQGVSGAPLVLGGSVAGVVIATDSRQSAATIRPLDFIAQFAGAELGGAVAAPAARRAPYAIDWMPAAMQTAIIAARDAAVLGEAEAERARALAADAQALADKAIDRPSDDQIAKLPQGTVMRYRDGNGLETFGQIYHRYNPKGGFSFGVEGLGVTRVTIGANAGDASAGYWINGYPRTGVLTRARNPGNTSGAIDYAGAFSNTAQKGGFGVSRSASSTESGQFQETVRKGVFVRKNGERVEGSWAAGGLPDGYVAIWNADGSFQIGGRYDKGTLVAPVTPP